MTWSGQLLEGYGAIVAGGGRGIGAATARTLAGAGASVAVIDVQTDRAEDVVSSIAGSGGTGLAITAELRQPEEIGRAVAQAKDAFGHLDILVNVAGGMNAYAPWRRTADWDEATWDEIVDRNLRYVFLAIRAVMPYFVDSGRGGAIVNITSISGETSAPNHAAYGAAKAGLANLTRTLAVEYGPEQIRVNAVAPGSVATPATSDRVGTLGAAPLEGRATPEDIANAVVFLASPLARFITGQTLLVDGGATAKFPLATPALGSTPSTP